MDCNFFAVTTRLRRGLQGRINWKKTGTIDYWYIRLWNKRTYLSELWLSSGTNLLTSYWLPVTYKQKSEFAAASLTSTDKALATVNCRHMHANSLETRRRSTATWFSTNSKRPKHDKSRMSDITHSCKLRSSEVQILPLQIRTSYIGLSVK